VVATPPRLDVGSSRPAQLENTSHGGLTRCVNEVAFRHELTREMRRSERHRLSLSCIFIGVDGMPPGLPRRQLIANIATAVRNGIRSEDTVGYCAGDGLLVLLPQSDETAAAQLAARLAEAIAAYAPGGSERSFAASIGVAQRRAGCSVETMLADVRAARSAARNARHGKRVGRNEPRVAVAGHLPAPAGDRPRQIDVCPMSPRELEVVRRLAQGMLCKQIAHELGLSASTVRQHLHNVYPKLGAVDRAQAVLIATKNGWI
jgi:DNA-binding NarL/FixJ family response regulator